MTTRSHPVQRYKNKAKWPISDISQWHSILEASPVAMPKDFIETWYMFIYFKLDWPNLRCMFCYFVICLHSEKHLYVSFACYRSKSCCLVK